MINKGEYQRLLAGWTIVPRWKQTYRNLVPGQADEMKQHELSEILSLMVKRNINKNVLFAAGTEYEAVWNLRGRPDPLPPGYEEDAKTWTLAAQFSNASAYQGYLVTTNVGFQWSRLAADNSEAVSELGSFITVYAGLGTEK
jgi:hypothetical protein